MGLSYTGAYSRYRQRIVPQQSAAVWGSGVNPVHAYRGDPGRPRNAKLDNGGMDPRLSTPAHMGNADYIEVHEPWGYDPADINGLDVFSDPEIAVNGMPFDQDGWPDWKEEEPVSNRADIAPYAQRPWQQPRSFYAAIRAIRGGPRDRDNRVSNQVPTESVNEGWLNKPASGMHDGQIPDARPADDSQVFVQTSMVQRYKTQNNDRALLREGPHSDVPRTPIESRVAPMKLKVYSGEQRHYDMDPYQANEMPRPFRYRTFGTGPENYLRSNDQHIRTALQRTPPPDPSLGTPDTELSSNGYGYESEDTGYY